MTTLLLTLYTLCALALGLYTAGQAILLWRYWRTRKRQTPTPAHGEWPALTVQLPLYNEANVADRLDRRCGGHGLPARQADDSSA